MQIEKDSAQVRFPPPLLLLGALVLGWLLQELAPLPPLPGRLKAPGLVLLVLAVGLVLYLNVVFKRRGTNIAPWKASSTLITSGPYAYSRNPIYLGFVLACIGVSLATANLWTLALALGLAALLRYLVIAKEEAYLQKKFRKEYRAYQAKVRRWF